MAITCQIMLSHLYSYVHVVSCFIFNRTTVHLNHTHNSIWKEEKGQVVHGFCFISLEVMISGFSFNPVLSNVNSVIVWF